MTSLVDRAMLQAQLRLDVGAGEDAYLDQILAAAHRAVAGHLDRPLDDPALSTDDRAVVGQAILVWATALYEDREGTDATPAAVTALLRPLRSFAR